MMKMIISAFVAVIVMSLGSMSAKADRRHSSDDETSMRVQDDDSSDWSERKVYRSHRSEERRMHTTAHNDHARRTHRTYVASAHRRRTHHTEMASNDNGHLRHRRSHESLHSSSGGGMTGMASYYSEPQRLASGGRFNPNAMTAAHKTLPFGTRVRVTSLSTGRSVNVTINDRGPYVGGRVIDLSSAAAGVIGMRGSGVARVRLDVIGRN